VPPGSSARASTISGVVVIEGFGPPRKQVHAGIGVHGYGAAIELDFVKPSRLRRSALGRGAVHRFDEVGFYLWEGN